jgi:hypothetical protein
VDGTRGRDGNAGAIPSRRSEGRAGDDVEHPVRLAIRRPRPPRVLHRQHELRHQRFVVRYEPSWSRLDSVE